MSDLRIFVVVNSEGEFVCTKVNYDEAWDTARLVNGALGELANVHRPQYLQEVMTPELAEAIEESLANPTSRVRRPSLVRKPDIDGGESDATLDRPSAA